MSHQLYEPCVVGAGGHCTRMSHDHSAEPRWPATQPEPDRTAKPKVIARLGRVVVTIDPKPQPPRPRGPRIIPVKPKTGHW